MRVLLAAGCVALVSASLSASRPHRRGSPASVSAPAALQEEAAGYLAFTHRSQLASARNRTFLAWVERYQGAPCVATTTLLDGTKTTGAEPAVARTVFDAARLLGDGFDPSQAYVISNLQLSTDGTLAHFTLERNEGANGNHAAVAPLSAIYRLDVGTDPRPPPVQLCAGCTLGAASPDGLRVAYAAGGALYVRDAPGADLAPLVVPSKGEIGEMKWSPDGASLAYVNDRADHALLAVVDVDANANADTYLQVRYMDASFDKDGASFNWSPSGESIAWVRLRYTLDADGAQPNALPFSVLVAPASASAADEPATVVYAETDGADAGYPLNAGYGARDVEWVDESTLMFMSEQSGRLHPMLLDATGKASPFDVFGAEQKCEAQSWLVDNAAKSVYISSGCCWAEGATDCADTLSITRHDLGADGTMEAAVLVVPGSDWLVAGMSESGQGMAPLADGALAYLQTTAAEMTAVWSTTHTPAPGALRGVGVAKFTQITASDPLPFDPSLFVQPSLVHIPGGGDAPDSGAGDDDSVDDDGSGGGYMISGQLFWPSDTALAKLGVAAGAKLPAIVFTHGGPMRQMYAAWHYSNDYAQLYGLNQWLANKGFVVLSLNYRMGVGYGKAFRDCLPGNDCGWRGGAEYLDVKAGAEWLAALPSQDVDPARIGIHGLSYGGLNALQGLCRDAGLFAAGVANAPVFNWVSTLRFTKAPWVDYSPSLEGEAVITGPEPEFAGPSWHGKVDANIKTAWGASPAAASAGLTVPLMLVHGDLDTNVDMQETMAVMRLQREAGREDDLEMVFLADEKHWPALYETQMEVCGLTVDFFLRRLDQQQAGAGTGTSSSKLVGEAV